MKVCPHCQEMSLGDARCDVCGGVIEAVAPVRVHTALADAFDLAEGPPLGQGSFAEVRAATERATGEPCAVKIVDLRRASQQARVRNQLRASFFREAEALTALRHPHIVGVRAYGAEDADRLFMVMELIPGGQTLHRVLRKASAKGKKAGLNTVLRVLEEVGAALSHIHGRGLVHRDLKPANIGIDAQRRFKLLDFGLVKCIEGGFEPGPDDETVAGWGSYNYGAPEQFFRGAVGPWTDIYALGAVVYEMIAGRPPVGDGSLERILEMMNRPAEPLPEDRERPLALTDLIMAMLQKCPADRPQSLDDVLMRVRGIRRHVRATAKGPGGSLDVSLSPAPAPRVTVTRSRRGDETRPADAVAIERILATMCQEAPPTLPPLDLSVCHERGGAAVVDAPAAARWPWAVGLAGGAAVVAGVVGLVGLIGYWLSVGRA